MTEPAVSEMEVIGIGCWSNGFANWPEFQRGFTTGQWSDDTQLKPEIIPPRERRRAPQSVKMAVEVMGQACEMAAVRPSDPAVVFTSAMGDMQITDAMCSILAENPALVSPTRFHNSVHNAAIGYWSIATGSYQPSTAVAGHDNSGALGLLEAGVQVCEDGVPVMFVCQEGAAPKTLHAIRPSANPLALALLLAPPGSAQRPLADLRFELIDGSEAKTTSDKEFSRDLPLDFAGNPTALLLPLFMILADVLSGQVPGRGRCQLALNEHCALAVSISAPGPTSEPDH